MPPASGTHCAPGWRSVFDRIRSKGLLRVKIYWSGGGRRTADEPPIADKLLHRENGRNVPTSDIAAEVDWVANNLNGSV